MANRYNNSTVSRARQRAMRKKRDLILVAGGAAVVALVVALIVLLPRGGAPDRAVQSAVQAEPEPVQQDQPAATEPPAFTPEPTPEPMPEPTPEPVSDRAMYRPTPTAEGFMPVFSRADTEEKIVAITVDDCYQADNLKQIVDKAIEVGAKLTIFPIGQNVLKQKQSEILKYAWENVFELENHTFTHNGLFAIDDKTLTEEVYKQQLALSYILGVEYQPHFLRPKGGDARGDQRMHMYAKQLGYYGIAHWSVSGASGNKKIAESLKPGAIFLFHTTDKDLAKLLAFIPWVAEQGYQMVTLNEMFGYPANETSEITTPLSEHVIPALEPYQMVYVPLEKTTYSWEAYLVQQKLIELGYLEGEPDGVYGEGCVTAMKAYQKDHGMEQTDVASPELIRSILEGAA